MSFLFSTTTIMKKYYLLLYLFFSTFLFAQVGINTTTPNAQLDIQSSNQAAPSNTDGMLIPKIDFFPAVNPGFNQNGMMVFLTNTVGTNTPGFYYWEAATNNWIKILIGNSGAGNLDDAYNFGGSGQGKEIIANFGPLTISGNDGILSSVLT